MRTVVLGIGNLLLCDEGVGVHVVHALQQRSLPENVVALDVGTAFLDALPEIERADRILVIDAMHGGEAPGTVYRVDFNACAHPEQIASMHGFDLSRVLYMSGRETPPETIVIGVEPLRIDWGTELSPAIADVVPDVVGVVLGELGCANARQPQASAADRDLNGATA